MNLPSCLYYCPECYMMKPVKIQESDDGMGNIWTVIEEPICVICGVIMKRFTGRSRTDHKINRIIDEVCGNETC